MRKRKGSTGSINGVRYKALKVLENIRRKLSHEISLSVTSVEVRSFLEFMLMRSVLFIQNLFKYMTDSFYELQESFHDKEVTWDFILSCVEHIFTHEFATARTVMSGHDLNEDSHKHKIMWNALRTVAIQEQFINIGFENHYSLAGAYYKFLLKNSQVNAVIKMRKKHEDLEKRHEVIEKLVKTLELRVKSAEGTASKALSGSGGGGNKKGGKKKDDE